MTSEVGADALVLTGITKQFGGAAALQDASLRVRRGTVHAVLGENGAGKTTMMRIAFGLAAADAGQIEIEGECRVLRSAADAIAAGVGMVHQHFTNVPAMTVVENVALGGGGRFDIDAARRDVKAIGERTGLVLAPDARADSLPVGAQQRLEIVKALARRARILILDEPTAVLAPSEADDLLRWMRDFIRDGNAVVLITHKLHEALQVADDVTVLRRGRVTLQAPAAGVGASELMVAMLGEDLGAGVARTESPRIGAVVASAREVTMLDDRGATVVRRASFEVATGEIVGVAAVEGAGQHHLLRALAGRLPIAAGELRLPPAIGFVPEDRHRDALVLDFSAAENVALEGAGARRGRLPWTNVRERAARLAREFDVRGVTARGPIRSLSGGNQQKLVLARELDGSPALLVVENPTRGLDVRATRDVHDRLRGAAASGAAVVVYSSDLDEVLSLATLVLVMHAGGVHECERDRTAVGRAMLGGAEPSA